MATLDAERFVDGGQDAIGSVRGSGDVRVGQDCEQLGRRATQDPRRVDVAHRTRKGRRHRLQGFLGWTGAIGLDQKHAEVALVPVSARQLVLEHGPYEAIVEQAGGAIDDVERFGLWVIGLDAA